MNETHNQPTVLSAECVLNGEIEMNGDLQIHGQVSGTVRISGALEIMPTAKVQGTIVAGTVKLGGSAQVNLIAEHGIELTQSAALSGRLYTTRLSVAEGAAFEGDINVGPTAMQAAQSLLDSMNRGEQEQMTETPFENDPAVQTDLSVIGRILNQRREKVLSASNVYDQAVHKTVENQAS